MARPNIDRSKLRNPDLKPGETMPKIEFILEDGMVYDTDGKVLTFTGILYDMYLEEPERNYEPYQKPIFTSDSDEDEIQILKQRNVTKKKKKKVVPSIEKEPDEYGNEDEDEVRITYSRNITKKKKKKVTTSIEKEPDEHGNEEEDEVRIIYSRNITKKKEKKVVRSIEKEPDEYGNEDEENKTDISSDDNISVKRKFDPDKVEKKQEKKKSKKQKSRSNSPRKTDSDRDEINNKKKEIEKERSRSGSPSCYQYETVVTCFDKISVKRKIDPDRDEKKRKKKIKKDGSGSPSRNRKHYSPQSSHRLCSSLDHKGHRHSRTPSPNHSIFTDYQDDSPRARHDKIVVYSLSPSPDLHHRHRSSSKHKGHRHSRTLSPDYRHDSPRARHDKVVDYCPSSSHDPHHRHSRTPSPDHRHDSPRARHDKVVYYCPSSSPDPHHRHSRTPSPDHRHDSPRARDDEIVDYFRSPAPEEHFDEVEVKIEAEEPVPEHLYGSYECEVCKVKMTSLELLNNHISGRKHFKALKLKKVAEVANRITSSAVSKEIPLKYPKISIGCTRRRVMTKSKIQDYVEELLTKPCPGLNLVIEIQGIGNTQYYCTLCDCICLTESIISHLNGFKHQLHLLRHYRPAEYEKMQFESRYAIEDDIKDILYDIQSKEGRGRITVEIEELASEDSSLDMNQPSTSKQSQPSTSYRSQPSTSYQSQPSTSRETDRRRQVPRDLYDLYEAAAIPDPKASDYFCKVCDSRMNAWVMWEAHIRGKRHLANLKKLPGAKPSRSKTVLIPNKRAHLLDRIKKELPDHEPIIGLSHIRETKFIEMNEFSYTCFICSSCHSSMEILAHLISLKHRTKYLEHLKYEGVEFTYDMSFYEASNLVKGMCADLEAEEGSGKPEVHVVKSFLIQ